MNIKCPEHPIAYLYKELLSDGKGKILCNFVNCTWESEVFERHEDIKIKTLAEKKREWE